MSKGLAGNYGGATDFGTEPCKSSIEDLKFL